MKKILAIETSCDETALAILEFSSEKFSNIHDLSYKIVSSSINSQVEIHKNFGGVFPSLAKREHAKNITDILEKSLIKAGYIFKLNKKIDKNKIKECQKILEREPDLFDNFQRLISRIDKLDIDLICVTSGPGLEPALWVGINFARALSYYFDIPMLPVNHMEGHIFSVINEAENKSDYNLLFPAIALLISGGHTELVEIKNIGGYKILGKTKDDAVGEAFDKVARILGLPYPGGPQISALADKARSNGLTSDIKLPRPMMKDGSLDFSFSGLKTAVLYLTKKILSDNNTGSLDNKMKELISMEFEDAVRDVLISKTKKALSLSDAKSLIVGGGVIANKFLRENFKKLENKNLKVFFPEKELSTDNAVMIGIAGFIKSLSKKGKICPDISASGNLTLSDNNK